MLKASKYEAGCQYTAAESIISTAAPKIQKPVRIAFLKGFHPLSPKSGAAPALMRRPIVYCAPEAADDVM